MENQNRFVDGMVKCSFEGCQEGHYCFGFHPAEYVTRDMAFDAGDLSLEGQLFQQEEYKWGACPCCEGAHFENCPKCAQSRSTSVSSTMV